MAEVIAEYELEDLVTSTALASVASVDMHQTVAASYLVQAPQVH